MATSLPLGQAPCRVKGQTTCAYHKGRQLKLYCNECKELACTQCLSNVHSRHPVCELREIIPAKKQDIQSFLDKSENVDLAEIDQSSHVIDAQLKNNSATFKKLSDGLIKRTEQLKLKLDRLTTETLSLYERMEKENMDLIESYKQELEKCNTKLSKQILECKQVLQHGVNIEVYDKWVEIDDLCVTLPVKPTLGTITFTPNKAPSKYLRLALGIGKESVENPDVSRQEHHLLLRTKVVEELQSPCRIGSLCFTSDGQLWTKYNKTLTLLDEKGTVIQEIGHNTWINSISVSPNTNVLWICDDDQILKLESGRLTHQFSTDDDALCVCITVNDHIIVGMAKYIAKFTTKGKMVSSTNVSGTHEPLVYSPYKISECPVTNNVAVADKNSKRDGGDGNQRIVVMDTNLEKLFVYDGELPKEYVASSRKPFDPSDIAYDSAGNLVIGDSNDCCVLLISGRGEFLRLLYKDTDKSWAVGLDKEGTLWTVFGGRHVKLLKYRRSV